MAQNSKIEWTDHTFNPWIGCQKVSPGCDHCYAETMMDHRYHKVQWGPHGQRVRTSEANWRGPLKWAKAEGDIRQRVFCASLADVFDKQAPQGARKDLFLLIHKTPQLDWMLLTKRPENIARMLPADWGNGWPNVWLGTTCEDQQHFDRRWPILRDVPAAVRFISYEPALGPWYWATPVRRGSSAGAKAALACAPGPWSRLGRAHFAMNVAQLASRSS